MNGYDDTAGDQNPPASNAGVTSGIDQDGLREEQELRLNLDLWKHEEGLRQQRNTVLLGANAFLAVGASALISASPPKETAFAIGLVIALFGLLICWIWHHLQQRHVAYADFRRKQLRELAKKLGYESWENHWRALRIPSETVPPPEPVEFPETADRFELRGSQQSAIKVESYLPGAVAAVWAIFAVGGVIALL